MNALKIATMFTFILAIISCTHAPNPIANFENGDLSSIKNNPKNYSKQKIRLGGKILSVNYTDKTTEIEIQSLSLNKSGRPFGDKSKGRFLAIVQDALDPAIYKENAYFTGVGVILENKNDNYQLILQVSEHKIWQENYNTNRQTVRNGFQSFGRDESPLGMQINLPIRF